MNVVDGRSCRGKKGGFLMGRGWVLPAVCHVLQIFVLLILWDFASWDVRVAEFAPLKVANSLCVIARANEGSTKLDVLVRAFLLEDLFPSFTLLHLEFRELFVVDELVALLLSASPLSIFTFAFFSLFSSSPPLFPSLGRFSLFFDSIGLWKVSGSAMLNQEGRMFM